jgi:hypothetical protein
MSLSMNGIKKFSLANITSTHLYLCNMRPVLFLLIGAFVLSAFVSEHKFYMSLTEVHHNKETRSLEVSTRFFTDDVERAISPEGQTIRVERSMDEELLPLMQRFYESETSIEIDGKKQDFNFIGYEVENELLYCFAEIKDVKRVSSMDLSATWLFDQFEDQVNIINVYIGEVKAAYLNPDERTHRFELMP